MAHCPKCGKKLKITDFSQFCPGCGVNMRFVNFEENFYKEAKLAELSQAAMHVKIKRLKAAFVGSKLTVARLAVMALPVLSLLLPGGAYLLRMPFLSEARAAGSFGAFGVYALFTNGSLDFLLRMTDSAISAQAFSALKLAFFAYFTVAAFAAIVLLLSLLCFISIRNMQKIIACAACCGVAACGCAMFFIARFVSVASDDPMLSGQNGFGLLLCMCMFAIVFLINVMLIKKGIPVEYAEGMEQRVEIRKRVRSGELDIDSLPQPIVETAETRKIDEEIAKEEAAYREKHVQEVLTNG